MLVYSYLFKSNKPKFLKNLSPKKKLNKSKQDDSPILEKKKKKKKTARKHLERFYGNKFKFLLEISNKGKGKSINSDARSNSNS